MSQAQRLLALNKQQLSNGQSPRVAGGNVSAMATTGNIGKGINIGRNDGASLTEISIDSDS